MSTTAFIATALVTMLLGLTFGAWVSSRFNKPPRPPMSDEDLRRLFDRHIEEHRRLNP